MNAHRTLAVALAAIGALDHACPPFRTTDPPCPRGDPVADARDARSGAIRAPSRPGRNAPCPCGSGRKFKACGLVNSCTPQPQPPQESTMLPAQPARPITCSACGHWHKVPTDPTNLGAPPQGRCLEHLHSAAVPAQDVAGRVALRTIPYYPTVPADMAACGRFKAAVAVVGS